ncbi:MAG: RluA family pseudouridine synthase [Candidatus Saccharimonadales bacterium]
MSNLSISRAQRLDQKVIELIPELSRAFAVRLISDKKVTVNGLPETKPGRKLKAGDEVLVDYATSDLSKIPAINLPVIYEDDDCLVIDKPAGILTHSKGAYNPEASVATFVSSKINDMRGNRAGIVHRLDRGTSGVIIVAKTPDSLKFLQRQFSTRKVKKTYVAVINGQIEPPAAIIDMPIERNPKSPQTFRVGAGGKSAKTTYKTLEFNDNYSLLELTPETGRTHQLRVHLNQLGHPVVGDIFYGGQAAERLMLHAKSLEISLPSGRRQVFSSAVPAEILDKMSKP